MSVEELLSLVAPRGGDVDPKDCLQCAKLVKRLREVSRKGDPQAAQRAANAMAVHKSYGHPEDTRPVGTDPLPGEPRIT